MLKFVALIHCLSEGFGKMKASKRFGINVMLLGMGAVVSRVFFRSYPYDSYRVVHDLVAGATLVGLVNILDDIISKDTSEIALDTAALAVGVGALERAPDFPRPSVYVRAAAGIYVGLSFLGLRKLAESAVACLQSDPIVEDKKGVVPKT